MPHDKHIADRFADIAALMADARTWAKTDARLGAHLAAYICVLLSGAIEDAVERMVSLRMGSVGDREVESYVVKAVARQFRNPDSAAITGLLGDFSEGYKRAWSTRFPNAHRVHESLRSILANKNALAHTGTMNLNLTMGDILTYYNEVVPAIDELERIICGVSVRLGSEL